MGKAPADQFYWGDWLRDDQLQQASASSRGIWANILGHAWFADERGTVSGTKKSLTRLGNCEPEEFETFLIEAKLHKFCDITVTVTDGHDIVTLINRRQSREYQKAEKEREQAAERKRRQREKEMSRDDVTLKSQEVTLPSSSSSSSSSSKEKNNGSFLADFGEWWKGYPNKQGRDRAKQYYFRWRQNGKTHEDLVNARERYLAKKRAEGSDVYSNGATFLNLKPIANSANISDYFEDWETPTTERIEIDGRMYTLPQLESLVAAGKVENDNGQWVMK